MTYADVTDVQVRLGRPPADASETSQWEAWLEDIEAIIKSRFADLDATVAGGRPTAATLILVEANAVIRKINNPTGMKSERVDDYYYDLGESGGKSDLFLTDAEWDLLTPNSPDGAFTITPFGMDHRKGQWIHPDVWVPLP